MNYPTSNVNIVAVSDSETVGTRLWGFMCLAHVHDYTVAGCVCECHV